MIKELHTTVQRNKLLYWAVLRENLPVSVTAVSVGVEVYSQ